MASSIVKLKCSNCGKLAEEESRSTFEEMVFIKLKCGHTFIEEAIKSRGYNLVSSDNRTLRPFQIDGVKFIEQSGGRCLIADEMGLGKTVQALAFLKLHPEVLPVGILVKSVAKVQWFGEVIRWDGLEFLPQIVADSKTPFLPGFSVYITTYDLLRRLSSAAKQELQLKTIILDECQQIKNHTSQRAKEVQGLCKDVENIIALSGTPIKNNAGEYFTILNLLKPKRFPFYAHYIRDYCDHYDNGWATKVGGLKNADWFHTQTSDFIIRRTWEEVDKEMPLINRNFFHVELAKKYVKAYQDIQDELEDDYFKEESSEDKCEGFMESAIAKMSKMRHLVGWNKIDPTVEFLEEWLTDSPPDKKIVIFTHHLDVTEALVVNIKAMLVKNNLDIHIKRITASQNGDARQLQVEEFKTDPLARICVASTLAAGESLNMQFCSDIILMERQWNPANEEQAEGRIRRIGQDSKSLNAVYTIASGTIDEFFTELVEQKRAIVASTLDNKEIPWDQQSLMKELLEVIIRKGGKRWKL
jgi:SWI/SNF-related matrix-associated actin-dependent regulator 1 of chromatin subfamily A